MTTQPFDYIAVNYIAVNYTVVNYTVVNYIVRWRNGSMR